ncbi:unnamed protein product [Rotaria magnacalcarata]|uniref:Uncharacterized protein n=1 Tax=Rotaria magnacalcarata TaxID=392030 RepID=A0A819KV18_9BILA|nr:unnamed protein product [Rotaria magnacalcarata]CAF2110588.1 unnamed protein product [Rotaria magnacalcarata]CAF2134625.1 unnamed protein product [Rotaria magnacalcarata]CAF3905628.1 unnamed protein product [Rotaria magnacalcarata]CAF3941366.1 unnamed protein product [Rotaria magnacalcarata]
MANEFHVKRAYVEACERNWSKQSSSKNHTSFNSIKLLNNIADGKRYLQGLGYILNLNNADGWNTFERTLCLNIELSGPSATEFKQLEFKIGGKNGTATYLLVATNVDCCNKVTVCYAFHHINEHILDHGGFTLRTADVTLDWMRAKSCESLAAMLPRDVAPRLIYE